MNLKHRYAPYLGIEPATFRYMGLLQPTEPSSQGSSPNSYVETLMSNVMVLIGVALGGCLSNEGGALMNGISAFIKEDPEGSLAPSPI